MEIKTGSEPDAREVSEYLEAGGLRWGLTFWRSANLTWPFARIRISPERVRLTAQSWGISDLTFDFEKAELQAVRRWGGLFSIGAQFEHQKADYPPFLLFWTFSPKVLFKELRRMGYNVRD